MSTKPRKKGALAILMGDSDSDSDNNTNIKIRDTDYNYNSHDVFDDYKVSDQIDNPYTNDSVLELMRICSASLDDNKLFR